MFMDTSLITNVLNGLITTVLCHKVCLFPWGLQIFKTIFLLRGTSRIQFYWVLTDFQSFFCVYRLATNFFTFPTEFLLKIDRISWTYHGKRRPNEFLA